MCVCVCELFIYYEYINTHTYSIYFENISMYKFIFIYFIYKYFKMYKHNIFFLNIYMHGCLFIYTGASQ